MRRGCNTVHEGRATVQVSPLLQLLLNILNLVRYILSREHLVLVT